MMHADENIIQLKHSVLCEVAKLAFAGTLETDKEFLPEKLVPGPQAQSRCCIYREREIIRQRIRLTEGKAPGEVDDGNIVQVLEAACADCPISSYTVTDNCQNCSGKACMSACRFGAISKGERHTYIDPAKCKECGLCAQACPFNAIAHLKRPCKFSCPVDAITYNEYGISQIDEKKCIRCGHCIHRCPFGAIGTKTFIVDVINALKSDKPVFAMLAPATEGQLGDDITMASWRVAMKELGFKDMVEVGLGADMTAQSEGKEWLEAYEAGEKKTTSCCPGFVNMIKKHFPELADMVSTTVSPMCAVSRMIKSKYPDACTVFIGPCVAKKSEVVDQKIEGNADYVLTYSEIRAMMRAKGVTLRPAEEKYQESSIFGKNFAQSGGVTNAVLEYLKESGVEEEIKVCKANGAQECRKALLLLKAGRLPENFIEGMACEGGCVGGASTMKQPNMVKRQREKMLAQADNRTITENLSKYDMDQFSMHRK